MLETLRPPRSWKALQPAIAPDTADGRRRLTDHRSINVLAESFIDLYVTELIRLCGSWQYMDDVDNVPLEYANLLTHADLHGEIGMLSRPLLVSPE